jgi:hypothetical protein
MHEKGRGEHCGTYELWILIYLIYHAGNKLYLLFIVQENWINLMYNSAGTPWKFFVTLRKTRGQQCGTDEL